MFMKRNDGYGWNDTEGSNVDYKFMCQLDPLSYRNLLMIAHENKILTFDVSYMINYVINNYPRKGDMPVE